MDNLCRILVASTLFAYITSFKLINKSLNLELAVRFNVQFSALRVEVSPRLTVDIHHTTSSERERDDQQPSVDGQRLNVVVHLEFSACRHHRCQICLGMRTALGIGRVINDDVFQTHFI